MILVTGATGFVGSNLCRRLGQLQVPYRALVRSSEKAEDRGLTSGAVAVGDLGRDLAPALDGVTAVVHLAGLVRALRAAEFDATNAAGTRSLVAAMARHAPAARLVHVSSLAAVGPSADGSGTAAAPGAARPVSAYGRSKLEAERHVAAAANPWLVLRPSIVYGPWDRDVLLMFRMLARGRMPLIGARDRYSLVHVDDLVDAIMAAVESPAVSLFLPVAHPEPIDQEDWLRRMARALDRRVRLVRLPRAAAGLSAAVAEVWARLRGRPAVFGRDKYREMRAGSWVADPAPAREALGFEAEISHDEGFRRTIAWYRDRGWLG